MEPSRFEVLLKALGWSQGKLATLLECDPAMVCRWSRSGKVPEPVAIWLEVLARHHMVNPVPKDWRVRKRSKAAPRGGQRPKVGAISRRK